MARVFRIIEVFIEYSITNKITTNAGSSNSWILIIEADFLSLICFLTWVFRIRNTASEAIIIEREWLEKDRGNMSIIVFPITAEMIRTAIE